MPTPEFVLEIRQHIGHALLPLVGATGVVVDRGRVLLHRRSDIGKWWVPGGIVEPGEQPAGAVVREVFEETGLHVEPRRLASVEAREPVTYPNGDQVQFLDLAFRCRAVGGELNAASDESLDVRWFALEALPDLHPKVVWWIARALEDGEPWFASH